MQCQIDTSDLIHRALHGNMDKLFDKRASERERGLAFNVLTFTANQQNPEFMDKNSIAIVNRCIASLKKGKKVSALEISLADTSIGLVAIVAGHRAHELYTASFSDLAEALNYGSSDLNVSKSMALLTFFGATNCEETQNGMQIIWKLINKISASTGSAKEDSLSALPALISAWTFLLTSVDGWDLSFKHWKGAISYFINILEEMDDEATGLAACEALTVILETDKLDKFSDQSSDLSKEEIIAKIKKFILKFKEQDHDQNLDYARELDFINDVIPSFEDDDFPQIPINIRGHLLTLSTYSKTIQFNYLKQFLGSGFELHMMENETLQDVFGIRPENHVHDEKLWEEVVVKCFQLKGRMRRTEEKEDIVVIESEDATKIKKTRLKRMEKIRRSALKKAKTQLLNKKRDLKKPSDLLDGEAGE